uniref:Uncharacterized protein n=1 Tax=Ditylenchus dipsaci TaxID=166011 RepID=A0A915D8E8_9BILA
MKNRIEQGCFLCSGCQARNESSANKSKVASLKFKIPATTWLDDPANYTHICEPTSNVTGTNIRRSFLAERAAGGGKQETAAAVRVRMDRRINIDCREKTKEAQRLSDAISRPTFSSWPVHILRVRVGCQVLVVTHVIKVTHQKIAELGWELLPWAPNFPDAAPSDYHLFWPSKTSLRGMDFGRNSEGLHDEIKEFVRLRPAGFFVGGISKLQERWEKIIEAEGNYFDE